VHSGQSFTVFALIPPGAELPTGVVVEAVMQSGRLQTTIAVPPASMHLRGKMIHAMAARQAVQDLLDGTSQLQLEANGSPEQVRKAVEQLGLQYSLATPYTSYVAVQEDGTVQCADSEMMAPTARAPAWGAGSSAMPTAPAWGAGYNASPASAALPTRKSAASPMQATLGPTKGGGGPYKSVPVGLFKGGGGGGSSGRPSPEGGLPAHFYGPTKSAERFRSAEANTSVASASPCVVCWEVPALATQTYGAAQLSQLVAMQTIYGYFLASTVLASLLGVSRGHIFTTPTMDFSSTLWTTAVVAMVLQKHDSSAGGMASCAKALHWLSQQPVNITELMDRARTFLAGRPQPAP
jgi:hypothetical protein